MPRNRDAKNIIRQYMADHGVAYNEAARQLGYRDAPVRAGFAVGAVGTLIGPYGPDVVVRVALDDGTPGWAVGWSDTLDSVMEEPIDLSDMIGETCTEFGPLRITVYVPDAEPEWIALRPVPSLEEVARIRPDADEWGVELDRDLRSETFEAVCNAAVDDYPVGTLITLAPEGGPVIEAALMTERGWASTLHQLRIASDTEVDPATVTPFPFPSTAPIRRLDFRYAIALEDPMEHTATVVGFWDDELWEWLHAEVDFGGASRIRTAVPGTDQEVSITAGSPVNDRALHIATDHPWLVHVEEVPVRDLPDIVATFRDRLGTDSVYEGLTY